MCALRYLLAGTAMYLFLRQRGAPRPTARQWAASALTAVLMLVIGNGAVALAEKTVASSLCAILLASIPLWAALFSGFWGRWPHAREWLGLLLGSVGVILLNLEGNLRANPTGAALVLLAAAGMALGSMWSRHLPLPQGPMASAAQLLSGGVLLFGMSLGNGDRLHALPSVESVGALLYLVVFGSLVGYSAYGYLLRNVRPALATSYAYVNPVVALLLGVGLLGERVGTVGLAGMGTILAGLAVLALTRASSRTASS